MLCFSGLQAIAQSGQWVWVHGDSTMLALGSYGVKYVSNPANNPPARYAAAHWKDLNGNLWLYGGDGHDDMWRYNTATNQWTWMGGSTVINNAPAYGTIGVPSTLNSPGAMQLTNCTWTDNNGDLWMLGGINQSLQMINTLWRYHIATNEWTWMNGTNFSVLGVYGTQGVASPFNMPPGFTEDNTGWVDAVGNLWFYCSGHSDMWKYNIATNEWTWLKGTQGLTSLGVYAAQNIYNASNLPPSGVCYSGSWQDQTGNYYVYIPNPGNGFMNEVWEYSPTLNQWRWVDRNPTPSNPYSTYQNHCLPNHLNYPRKNVDYRTCQNYCPNTFWLYGGDYPDNDLWIYNVKSRAWNWVTGTPNSTPLFGIKGVYNTYNSPPDGTGNCLWNDGANNLYLFGGGKTNSVWKYTPDINCIAPSCVNDSTVYLTMCNGDTLTLPNGLHITSTSINIDTVINGANTVYIYYYVTVLNQILVNINYVIGCNGSLQLPNGTVVNQPGTYYDTLTSHTGCDSVLAIHVLHPTPALYIYCNKIPITLPNGTITQTPGIYIDSLTSYTGCDSIIITTIYPMPVANFTFQDTVCAGSPIIFTNASVGDTSAIPNPNFGISYNEWHYNDTSASSVSSNNPNFTNTVNNGYHIYHQQGVYTAMLMVHNGGNCFDTIYKTVHVSRVPLPVTLQVTHDSVCVPLDTTTVYWVGTPTAGYGYHWLLNNAWLIKGNENSYLPITVQWNTGGVHTIGFTITPPVGDTICPTSGSINIFTKGVNPYAKIVGDNFICKNAIDTLSTLSLATNCGAASAGCLNPLTYHVGSFYKQAVFASTAVTPFIDSKAESRIQNLYYAYELNDLGMTPGTISELSLIVLTKNSTSSIKNLTIKMACVSYNQFTGTSFDTTSPLTTVYTDTGYNTIAGVNNFVFQTPYNWDGVSNLLVDICTSSNTSTSGDDEVALYYVPGSLPNQMLQYRNAANTINPCSHLLGTTYGPIKMALWFKECRNYGLSVPNTNYTWSSIPSGFSSSQADVIVAPTTTTTYVLTASNGVCSSVDTFTVHPITPNTIHLPDDTFICNNGFIPAFNFSAHATGLHQLNGSVQCGTAVPCTNNMIPFVIANGTINGGPVSPFYGQIENFKMLMRYKAVDLKQAGLSACMIDSIGFFITQKNSTYPFNSYNVKMSCVPDTTPAFSNFPGGTTVAYYTSFTTHLGWQMLPLQNAFIWDGSSDILIEVCYSLANFQPGIDMVRKSYYPEIRSIYSYSANPMAVPGCNLYQFVFNSFYAFSHQLPDLRLAVCDADTSLTIPFNYTWQSFPTDTSLNNLNDSSVTVTPNVTTTYVVTLGGVPMCSPSDTFVVTIAPLQLPDTIVATNCSGLPFVLANGDSVFVSGVYSDTFANHLGCDSITTYLVSFVSPTADSVWVAICSNGNYTLPNGTIVNAVGIYVDTIPNHAGCDSIVTTVLSYTTMPHDSVYTSFCNNKNYTLPGGGVVNSAGVYIDTVLNAVGCDSIVTVFLSAKNISIDTVKTSICANQFYTLPNGGLANSTGTYRDTMMNAVGCDSIVVTQLTVLPISSSTQNIIICDGQTATLPDGSTVNTFGTFIDTLPNHFLCDSIITTQVVLINKPVFDWAVDTTICEGTILHLTAPDFLNATYLWQDNSTKTYFDAAQPGTYLLQITLSPCPPVVDSMVVKFKDCECDVHYPNAFSPNADGLDDVWKPVIDCDLPMNDYLLRIYNRWGQMVFQTTDYRAGWDGIFNSLPQQIATFVYYVEYVNPTNGYRVFHKGDISLIR